MTTAIVSTLIGGLLALAGAFIGPFLQRKHDRWMANRDDRRLLRDKAQELFDELDRVVLESRRASMSAVARLQDKTAENVPVPDLGRVRAIAAIYFPTSLELIEAYEERHSKLMMLMVEEVKNAVGNGADGLDTLRALPMITTVQFQKFTSDFVNEMRKHLADNAPKLELTET